MKEKYLYLQMMFLMFMMLFSFCLIINGRSQNRIYENHEMFEPRSMIRQIIGRFDRNRTDPSFYMHGPLLTHTYSESGIITLIDLEGRPERWIS